ncbi:MAG: hypothetical protein ACRDKW_17100 [Actinomycetota bacterium]
MSTPPEIRPIRPRVFGIPAGEAPVVAVLQRGPSAWCHTGRWELEPPAYEPGSWVHGTLYPQRCDLSPDGRWLAYFLHKPAAAWAPGGTYLAISRLPWLRALVAWGTGGTWTGGIHFVADTGAWELPEPDAGDAWDQQRSGRIVMQKPRPAGDPLLEVRGDYAETRSLHGQRTDCAYTLRAGPRGLRVEDVQWADWDRRGRLLVATGDGRIQVRRYSAGGWELEWEHSLPSRPDPAPPPPEGGW